MIAGGSGNITFEYGTGTTCGTGTTASFTAGSSVFAPNGGVYQSTATSNPLTSGKQGLAQLTQYRALFTNLRDSSSNQLGIASNPLQVSLANNGANGTALAVSNSQEHTDLMTLNAAIGSPPPLSVNGTNASWPGLTPGTSQTGAIIAANTDLSSVRGKAAIAADSSAPINVSTATTTQLVGLVAGQKIYVTSFDAGQRGGGSDADWPSASASGAGERIEHDRRGDTGEQPLDDHRDAPATRTARRPLPLAMPVCAGRLQTFPPAMPFASSRPPPSR